MTDRRSLEAYAARIAPLIDAVHESVHRASAARARAALAGLDAPPERGFLLTLRYALLREPLELDGVRATNRYVPTEDLDRTVAALLDTGWLSRSGSAGRAGGVGSGGGAGGAERLAATERARRFLLRLYDLHAEVTATLWSDADPGLLDEAARLTARLLESGRPTGGAAFAAASPPYERPGDPAGLVLFNRLAAFRYHRADAHAAAWRAEGLTAEGVRALGSGPARDRIEAETNRLAAAPFGALEPAEGQTLLTALATLEAYGEIEHDRGAPTMLRMDHLGIVVEDLEAALEFFVEVGFELRGRASLGGEDVDRINGLEGVRAEIAMLRTPDHSGQIELCRYEAPADLDGPGVQVLPPTRPGFRHIAFEVEDVDGMLERLQGKGFGLVGEKRDFSGYRLVYLRGPEGLIVEFAQQLPERSDADEA